ncbi:YunG family protein [Bacillus cereus group sp. MYBK79-1]|uniref:YunG family protein n=1 Tax=unclassified Bacillus cereus group TaxID=2750818 RepID=UPI003F79EB51
MDNVKAKRIYEELIKSWSIETSSKWTLENPVKGQCGVTALVIQDIYGGKIKKTKVGEEWHFYNCIAGQRFDFTETQFSGKLNYLDVESNREEAFADTNGKQYSILKEKIMKELKLSFDS